MLKERKTAQSGGRVSNVCAYMPYVADLINELCVDLPHCFLELAGVKIRRGLSLKFLSLFESPDTKEWVGVVGRENAMEKMKE